MCTRRELNPRPPDYKSGALPLSYASFYLFNSYIQPTPPEGLEPSTSRLEVWRSIQLC